jgi:hypothetical protein
MNLEYATQIARDWNVRDSGAGYVTRFEVEEEFLQRYPVQRVGGSLHAELWVPAEELDEFNRHIARSWGFIWIYRQLSPLSEDFCRSR